VTPGEPDPKAVEGQSAPGRPAPSPIVLLATGVLYPALLLAAVLLTLRGHHEPGGGFVGGLFATVAVMTVALVQGPKIARRRLRIPPIALASVGVLLALCSGLPALIAGEPFLTHAVGYLPMIGGAWKLSTALLFDFGVLLCVLGAVTGFCLRLLESA